MGSIPTRGSEEVHLPVIAFDVDNTLLILDKNTPPPHSVTTNEDVRALLVAIWKLGLAHIVVWSGGGADYAEFATRDCGIRHMVWDYWGKGNFPFYPDICIDDQYMSQQMAKVRLKIEGDIEPTPWMGIGEDNAKV